jgi:hypothetical protein
LIAAMNAPRTYSSSCTAPTRSTPIPTWSPWFATYTSVHPDAAGLAASTADFRRSSLLAYLGLQTVPWLSTELVLVALARRRRGRERTDAPASSVALVP